MPSAVSKFLNWGGGSSCFLTIQKKKKRERDEALEFSSNKFNFIKYIMKYLKNILKVQSILKGCKREYWITRLFIMKIKLQFFLVVFGIFFLCRRLICNLISGKIQVRKGTHGRNFQAMIIWKLQLFTTSYWSSR